MTVHNLEEALGIDRFRRDLAQLQPWFVLPRRTFLAPLALLALATWAVAVVAADQGGRGPWTDTLIGFQAGLLVNALVPHLVLLVRLRRYSPGVGSALLRNVPFVVALLAARLS
jgi:hypothetical protein